MKRIYNITVLLLCVTALLQAQTVDRSIRPSAAPAKAIEIKDAKTFTLSNGLKVFVVEDHRAPIVYYSLLLDVKPALSGDKAGLNDVFGEVMGTATQTKTKEELNREIDLIGAKINASNRGGSGAGLKKYNTKILALLSDMIMNPRFTQEELDLVKGQVRSGLEFISDDPGSIGQRLSAALVYGNGYPDGELETTETIDKIFVNDLGDFYATYFAPNVSRLVVVGDVTVAEVKANIKKYFGPWKKKNVPVTSYTIPQAPDQPKVAMYNKDGAVQSIINLTYPIAYKPGAADAEAATIAGHILGGSASGRLFQNLREERSYTYGAYSRLKQGELIGLFEITDGRSSGPSIKAEATDTALTQVIYEINQLRNTPVTEDILSGAKASLAGNFGRSLQNSSTIASFAVNIDKYKLPADYYKNYLKRLEAVTIADVQAAAKKYFKPDQAWIIVVGDKKHADGLKQFAADKTVQFYDINANPVVAPETKTADLSAEQLINKYVEALGGKAAINAITDYKMTATMQMMGQEMSVTRLFKAPHYSLMSIGMGGTVVQKVVFDGVALRMSGMGGNQEFKEGEEFEAAKAEAAVCSEMYFIENGYDLTVNGVEKIADTDVYVLEVVKGKSTVIYYFDTKTFLCLRTSTTAETPQGIVQQITEFSDYRPANGVLFPYTNVQKVPAMGVEMTMKISDIQINTGLSADDFK